MQSNSIRSHPIMTELYQQNVWQIIYQIIISRSGLVGNRWLALNAHWKKPRKMILYVFWGLFLLLVPFVRFLKVFKSYKVASAWQTKTRSIYLDFDRTYVLKHPQTNTISGFAGVLFWYKVIAFFTIFLLWINFF